MTETPRGLRFDLHVHSQFSPDGAGSIREIAQEARRKGLRGFALTDHNVFPPKERLAEAREVGLVAVPGTEVSTVEGHCLAIGIQREVAPRKPLAETIEAVRDAGGVAIPSHPYRRVHGVGERALDAVRSALTTIEVYNASDGHTRRNARADAYARRHGLAGSGGSDAHRVVEVGNAYALIEGAVDHVDNLVSWLQKGKSWGAGTPTPWGTLLRQKTKTSLLWLRRGMRSI